MSLNEEMSQSLINQGYIPILNYDFINFDGMCVAIPYKSGIYSNKISRD